MVFSGTVESDFVKLVTMPDTKKTQFINFAAADFVTIRNSLIEYIKSVYPLDYHNFAESDLGMMLIEVVSYMGAVTSMKADMLANENFLRTSRNRNNVKKLLELIGVSMKGPISSAAEATLHLDSTPASFSSDTPITILPQNRSISITSPEDGGPLNFTLYKEVNGDVDISNANAEISLRGGEADNATSSLFSNLVLLEGAYVVTSGAFTTTEAVKTVPLTESPVVEGSVEVFIRSSDPEVSGPYTRVDNLFFASGATDRIFQSVYDDDFRATVIFGDGNLGASPDINAEYIISYRAGGGSRGNIPAEFINTTTTVVDGGTTVNGILENDTIGTGGSDAETIDHAKKYAPFTFKRQDRLVTLEDYTAFVNSFVGPLGVMGKGRAVTRKAFSSANVLDLYVLQKASSLQLQRATSAFKIDLLTAINTKKMITDEVVVVDGLIRTLDLITTIRVDKFNEPREEEIKLAVRDRILTFFEVDNFDFGQSLVLADLNRAIFELNDVRYSTVDNLDENVSVDFNEIIQLNTLTINVELV